MLLATKLSLTRHGFPMFASNAWLRSVTLAAILATPVFAVDPTIRPLLDVSKADIAGSFTTEAANQVSFTQTSSGLAVTVKPGEAGYPGIMSVPATPWDLSMYGHVEARVTNTGTSPITVALRLDNDGDWKKGPNNSEHIGLQPGKSGTIRLYFGYSFGKKAFPLDSHKITRLLVFSTKTAKDQSYTIESLNLCGVPGEAPPVADEQVRTTPPKGVILGAGTVIDAGKQLIAREATATVAEVAGHPAIAISAPAGKATSTVTFKPAIGRWLLSDWLNATVVVRNDGPQPLTIRARLEGDGSTDVIDATIAPGTSHELIIPFAAAKIWTAEKTGNQFKNNKASAVVVELPAADAARTCTITGITAGMPVQVLPEWLGQRPPEPGEWTKTFSDEFDGATIDQTKWNIYTANYWDKRTHFAAENVVMGGGMVKLHFEKKTGFHNDDPKGQQTDYACGFLDSYGKWTQRFGYFEARIKLPTAPGLWPAFWTMPDRGVAAGEQWKRASTSDGGMEMDIVEHLTGWGPNRYNIAMHWDGYKKDHKATGCDVNYVQPDKDGFIVAGLLWEPGKLTYYNNGKPLLCWENPRVGTIASYAIFNIVTGGWDNTPLDDATLPADMCIDWIRCWQRKDLEK